MLRPTVKDPKLSVYFELCLVLLFGVRVSMDLGPFLLDEHRQHLHLGCAEYVPQWCEEDVGHIWDDKTGLHLHGGGGHVLAVLHPGPHQRPVGPPVPAAPRHEHDQRGSPLYPGEDHVAEHASHQHNSRHGLTEPHQVWPFQIDHPGPPYQSGQDQLHHTPLAHPGL